MAIDLWNDDTRIVLHAWPSAATMKSTSIYCASSVIQFSAAALMPPDLILGLGKIFYRSRRLRLDNDIQYKGLDVCAVLSTTIFAYLDDSTLTFSRRKVKGLPTQHAGVLTPQWAATCYPAFSRHACLSTSTDMLNAEVPMVTNLYRCPAD